MKIAIAALAAVVAFGGESHDSGARVETWSQTRDGAIWTLTATVQETAGPRQLPGQLVRFTVRRNGKFLHSTLSFDGGRLAGMKWGFGGESWLKVEDLVPEAGPGWIVHVPESAGSAMSLHACVVTPRENSYDTLVIGTKDPLVQRVTARGVDLWGSYQEWGGGGTSTSVFVPFRIHVGPGIAPRREPLPSDALVCVDSVGMMGFAGVFIGGMRERNPDLMRDALDRLFVEPEPEPETMSLTEREAGLGLPTRRRKLEDMVDCVRRIAEARAALVRHARSIPPDYAHPAREE
jgi:hypothetical protein